MLYVIAVSFLNKLYLLIYFQFPKEQFLKFHTRELLHSTSEIQNVIQRLKLLDGKDPVFYFFEWTPLSVFCV